MLAQQALQKTTPLSLVYKLLRLGCILSPGCQAGVRGLLGLLPRDEGPEVCARRLWCVLLCWWQSRDVYS